MRPFFDGGLGVEEGVWWWWRGWNNMGRREGQMREGILRVGRRMREGGKEEGGGKRRGEEGRRGRS